MKSFFTAIFEYNRHYNRQLAEAILMQGELAPEKSVLLFNHLLNAHHIWISRVEQKPHTVGIDTIHPADRLAAFDDDNFHRTMQVIDNRDLDELIRYQNLKGNFFENSIREILFHIVNHATYHRGQIATDFRLAGITPIPTDYILYKRPAF